MVKKANEAALSRQSEKAASLLPGSVCRHCFPEALHRLPRGAGYTQPWASMALATFMKPPMLAPTT